MQSQRALALGRRFARLVAVLGVLAAALAAPPAAHAETAPPIDSAQRRLGGDLFAGGGTISVDEAVGGDLFAGGGTVEVNAPVAGDAVTAGGRLRLGADVGQTVYAAGGQLSVLAKVGHNARIAGGQVEFGPKSEVAGNLSVAGGQVRLRGRIGGQVQMAGGRLLIDGPIAGDVLAAGGSLSLGPNARIEGRLRYHAGEALEQDPGAVVAGGIEEFEPPFARGRAGASAPHAPPGRGGPVGIWTVGLGLLAALLVLALPRFSAQVSRSLRERTALSLLVGFVVLVCAPVAALLLVITLVGLPIALAALALYVAMLPIAYAASAVCLGDFALRQWRPGHLARRGWRVGAAAAAVLVLALVGWVPWIGGIVLAGALLAGLGAIVMQATPLRPAEAD